MRISTFFYCIKQGLQNIIRNKLFSLASIGTICASVFLLGVFYSVVINFNNIIREAETKVGITIFFDKDVSYDQARMEEIAAQIEKRTEVQKMVFVSAEEAWEHYKDKYFEGRPEMAEGFAQDNPLAASASYEIYLNNVEEQAAFVEYLKGIPGIRRINYSEMAVRGLVSVNKIITYVSVVIVAVLIFVAIFLITNTIGLSISVRREEIRIMRLIGATKFFIRQPFIVEGILIGLIGAGIPLAIIYYIYMNVVSYAAERLKLLSGLFVFLPVHQIMTILIPVALVLGVGIGFFGSIFSVRKHLRA